MKKTVTKKPVVKKTVKKVQTKAIPFNKKNAELFTDLIYSDKGGRVSFLKLCSGELSNGKDDGRTLHCALGEAYFVFVDSNVANFVNETTEKFGDDVKYRFNDNDEHVVMEGCYQPKYFDDEPAVGHTATLAVIDALVDVAQLRNKKPDTKKQLAQALLETMQANDDACGVGVDDQLNRSLEVSEMWWNNVVPLLK